MKKTVIGTICLFFTSMGSSQPLSPIGPLLPILPENIFQINSFDEYFLYQDFEYLLFESRIKGAAHKLAKDRVRIIDDIEAEMIDSRYFFDRSGKLMKWQKNPGNLNRERYIELNYLKDKLIEIKAYNIVRGYDYEYLVANYLDDPDQFWDLMDVEFIDTICIKYLYDEDGRVIGNRISGKYDTLTCDYSYNEGMLSEVIHKYNDRIVSVNEFIPTIYGYDYFVDNVKKKEFWFGNSHLSTMHDLDSNYLFITGSGSDVYTTELTILSPGYNKIVHHYIDGLNVSASQSLQYTAFREEFNRVHYRDYSSSASFKTRRKYSYKNDITTDREYFIDGDAPCEVFKESKEFTIKTHKVQHSPKCLPEVRKSNR